MSHTEPMPENAQSIKEFLAHGAATASQISREIGLTKIDVYAALVWLEARRLAFVYVRYSGRSNRAGYWEAA